MTSMLSSKFKEYLGQHSYTPVTRKRSLEEESAEEGREPASKRRRSQDTSEESPVTGRRGDTKSNEHYTILKTTAKRLSHMWSWVTNFLSPGSFNELDMSDATSSDEIQYMGTSQRIRSNPLNKRREIKHRSMEIKKWEHQKIAASIDPSFRFNPSITSTASKGSLVFPSDKSKYPSYEKYGGQNSAVTRTKLPPFKKSSLIASDPVKYKAKIKCYDKSKMLSRLMGSKGSGKSIREAFQHDDKLKYQELLKQFTTKGNNLNSSGKIPSLNSSYNSNSSSFLTRTRLDPEWTKEKRKEMEKVAPMKSAIQTPVYQQSTNKPSLRLDESDYSKNLSRSAPSNLPLIRKKTSVDDDCVIIREEIKSPSRTNTLETSLLLSPVLDKKWVDELNQKYKIRSKTKEEEIRKYEEQRKISEEVRKKSQPTLNERLDHRLSLLSLKYPARIEKLIEDEDEEEELPELTQEMNDMIDGSLEKGNSSVLVDKFNIQITRKDIATLVGLNWLNDEVINFYMNLLMERGKTEENLPKVYAFNTFFYPKLVNNGYSSIRRWTKKVDIFSHDLLLVPVHLGMHWCLATMDLRSKKVSYYDSMYGDNDRCLKALIQYLESEHQDKKQSAYDTSGWSLQNIKDIPQQMNGSDCGMFACKFSEYLSRNAKITFDQEHMPYFRRRMIYEIVAAKLL